MKNIMAETFFGFPLNKGITPNSLHFLWLELNCYIEKPYKRLSYNEFKTHLFNGFFIYCRKNYEMTPFLHKDMSLDIFTYYLNKYLEKGNNSKLFIDLIQSQKMNLFFNEFIKYVALYFIM